MGTGHHAATSNNMKSVHWPLMGGQQPAHAPPRCTKCSSPPIKGKCTNQRIAVRVNGPLLCSLNVPVKGLRCSVATQTR